MRKMKQVREIAYAILNVWPILKGKLSWNHNIWTLLEMQTTEWEVVSAKE